MVTRYSYMKFIKNTLLKIYWKIFRTKTLGVKLLLVNNGKVLLLRHSYIKGFFLPGGGVEDGEVFAEAAKREALEELGLEIENLNFFGVYQNKKEGKIDTIVVFISNDPIDIAKVELGEEINHVDFYHLDNLPADISPGSKRRIEEYRSKNFPTTVEW